MPKPDVSELELQRERITAEVEAYQQACAKTLAAAKLAKEHRLQREEEHKQALEQYNMSKQERTTLLDRLRPLRDVNKQVSEQRRQMGDRKSQLPASTVAELDAKINELEFKQAHEPMDRRSENNLIAEIRKFKKTRPEVMKYEMDNQQVLRPHSTLWPVLIVMSHTLFSCIMHRYLHHRQCHSHLCDTGSGYT